MAAENVLMQGKRSAGFVPLSDLPLTENFLFGETMSYEEPCKLFLDAVLKGIGGSVGKLVEVSKEKDLSDLKNGHGSRGDVYARNRRRAQFDIEMQMENNDDLFRRIRYYQSALDRQSLKKNHKYKTLTDSFVIFICNFDFLGKGEAMYVLRQYDETTGTPCYDGRLAIILNINYKNPGKASKGLLEFLDYLRTNNCEKPQGKLMTSVLATLERVRSDGAVEGRYMSYLEKIQREREEAEHEGFQKGIREGALKRAVELYLCNEVPLEAAVKFSGITKEEFLAAVNKQKN